MRPLPFNCRLLGGAAKKDVEVVAPAVSKDGKHDVIFPVGLPNELTFDWVDKFVIANPQYTELSDRKLIDWAVKSGIPRRSSVESSRDKPEGGFHIPSLDDFSARKVLTSLATIFPRNYVVMEVKQNLIADDRISNLKMFSNPSYKKIAKVLIGEPSSDSVKTLQDDILSKKQAVLDAAFKVKQDAKVKAKEKEAKRKAADEARKEALAQAKQRAAEAKQKLEDSKNDDAADATGSAPKIEEVVHDVTTTDGPVAPVDDAEPVDAAEKTEDLEDEPPKAELTEEEMKLRFPHSDIPDLTPFAFSKHFLQFSMPTESDGFDSVTYEVAKAGIAASYFEKYIKEKKLMTRLDHLVPQQWFTDLNDKFSATCLDWRSKSRADKNGGDEVSRLSSVDPMTVEDVCDVGEGMSLFCNFMPEDWALVQLRHELALLVMVFQKDVADVDLPGVPVDHVGFYYNKFFGKALMPKMYKKETFCDLIDFVKDTVSVDTATNMLKSSVSDGAEPTLEYFVRHTEVARMSRQRRIDAGDDTAALMFAAPLLQPGGIKSVGNLPQARLPQNVGHVIKPAGFKGGKKGRS